MNELEQLLRRVIREELEAFERRRAVSDTTSIEHDELADLVADLAAGARRKRGAR